MDEGTERLEMERRERDLGELLGLVAAEVAKDGGSVSLIDVDYRSGVLTVALGGACGSCSLTGSTLEDGLVRILTQRLDWVTEVRGVVDETSGVPGTGNWRPR